ncbi:MAG TPA: AraC family transcriptional regulator [Polyangiaceae bacterium]|nr:AraC family transcriptional regulator [Polyangiaceae bacterium]
MTPPAYRARFRRILDHVDQNLGGDLAVDRLADLAGFSRFHFHRQFSATFGIGVHEYVRLARLRRASFELAFRGDSSVLRVALENGYESPEGFSRAFKKLAGQTPTEFRQEPDWTAVRDALRPFDHVRREMNTRTQYGPVTLVDFPETPVAVLQHRGDPRTIGDTIRRFIEWRRANGLPPSASATYNLLYGDPETTPPEEFRLDLCAGIRAPVAENSYGVVESVIPAGRCAVLRLVGGDEQFAPAFQFLYGEWLPASGHELRDFPLFLQRVKMFPDVPENESVIDVFLPLS